MSEIIGSLFGVTADQYERNRELEQDKLAFQLAQANSRTRASFLLQSGARGLGNVIGRALGGEDPELRRISRRNQILGTIDPSRPETFEMAAQAALESDQPDLAFGLRAEAEANKRKVLESDALIFQRMKEKEVLAPNEVRLAQATAALEGAPGSPEYDAAYKAALKELIAPKAANAPSFGAEAERLAKSMFMKTYAALTPSEAEVVNKRIEQVNRVETTKIVLPAQENEFEKGLGAGQAKRLLDNQVAAQGAADILRTNQVGRDLLTSGAITGTGANLFVGLNNALTQAGLDFGYADAAANSQAYVASMGANVGQIIKQFGAGTGLSDADRKYAEQMAGGKITLTEAALRKILDINDRAANNVIDLHNNRVKGIKTNVPLTVEKPTFGAPSGAAQIPDQSLAPIYANNGKERIMSTDGGKTWGPAR